MTSTGPCSSRFTASVRNVGWLRAAQNFRKVNSPAVAVIINESPSRNCHLISVQPSLRHWLMFLELKIDELRTSKDAEQHQNGNRCTITE